MQAMSHGHDFLAGDLHPPTAEELATRSRAHAAAVLRNYHAQPRIGACSCFSSKRREYDALPQSTAQ